MKHLIILAALLVSTAFAVVPNSNKSDGSSRIVNGITVTDPTETYYFASIAVGGQHVCGGLIYNEQWIITAGSCVAGRVSSQLEVTVGSTSLTTTEETEQKFNVFRIYNYDPPYNNATKLHDIALLELSRTIILGAAANLIPYDEPDFTATGGKGKIAGFGAREAGGLLSTRLLKAEVTLNGANCTGPNFNRAYMYCAGTEDDMGASPCAFDEGSPMIQVQEAPFGTLAIGIVSNFGAACNSSAVYTQLSSYYAWIRNTAGQQGTPAPPPY